MKQDERNFELGEIYDDADATIFRFGTDAVTVFSQRGACVIRPWHWRPADLKNFPEASEHMVKGIKSLRESPKEWKGKISLGELIVWSSRRTRRDDWMPPEDDDTPMFIIGRSSIDAQPIGQRVFNRRLIREASQAFIENWEAGDSSSQVLCSIKTLSNGAALSMTLHDIEVYVMSLSDSVGAGDERMPNSRCECQLEPGDSPCPVHGDEDA